MCAHLHAQGPAARHRELLRGQLAHRGLPFGSALLVTGLANETVSACVPATIAEGVCHAAILNAAGEPITGAVSNSVAILVKGGMSSMAIVKGSKVAAVVMLLCAFAGAGVGLALGLTWASDNQGRSSKVELQVPDQKDVAKQPGQKIEGPPALDAHGDPLPPGALLRMGTQRLRHGGALKSLAWSPDGQTLAVGSGGLDFAVRLWDVATGKEIRAFEKQQTGFFQVAFSPDGSLVASVDRRGGLYLWDALTAKVRNVRKLSEQATVSFASNGKSFITIDEKGQACLLETATLKTLRVFSSGRGLQAPQAHVAWSADGKIVAAADTSDKLRLFEVLTGNVLHTLDLPGPIDHLSISPDNRLLATAGKDKIARLWNIADCNMPAELEGHTRPIKGAAWSPDSKTLATISGDKTARLWDVRTRKEFLTFTHPHAAAGDQGNIQCVAFSPDGKLVASIGIDGDNAVHIWSAQTGKEVINYDDHLGYIVGMALLDGGKSLLTSAADENIRLWNLASGKAESQLHVPHTRRSNRRDAGWQAPRRRQATAGFESWSCPRARCSSKSRWTSRRYSVWQFLPMGKPWRRQATISDCLFGTSPAARLSTNSGTPTNVFARSRSVPMARYYARAAAKERYAFGMWPMARRWHGLPATQDEWTAWSFSQRICCCFQ